MQVLIVSLNKLWVRYVEQSKGMSTSSNWDRISVELISSSWQCLTEFELNCEASEAGGDDAFFPTQPELLHHLAGHPGMKLYRDGDVAI